MRALRRVVVVGAGHAAIEAAAAAARMDVGVLMVTLDPASIGRLSCNPAMGGIGKGHLIREIDALGGVVGIASDLGGIHFKVLNRSRGPAVHGLRAQQDYDRYPAIVGSILGQLPNLEILQGEVTGLVVNREGVLGVQLLGGEVIEATACVVTTGTFLRGLMYRGDEITAGGRSGEAASNGLSDWLRGVGLRLGRFKTGTPPRLVRESLRLERFEEQPGDDPPVPFSFVHLGEPFLPKLPQVPMHVTASNPRSHQIVREHLHLSPLYSGKIQASGPRYCPSFEDKVVRFADRDRHLLHLEPLGLDHPWVYVNGLSTSLPPLVQEQLVRSIDGLEDVEIARFGYAVEYDFVQPTQLDSTLGLPQIQGLFFAGQICGTTGYEEASALGLVAGINAGRYALGEAPWIPSRWESYLGVLVDDLTTRGVLEPYRMFTSRAEMRLTLSPDTADRRLTAMGERLGVVPPARARRTEARWATLDAAIRALDSAGPLRGSRREVPGDRIRRGEELDAVLADHLPAAKELPRADLETLESLILYRGYLDREAAEVARLADAERIRIPVDFSFESLSGLSAEVIQRLGENRPRSVGQAARIPGITPAALSLLSAAVRRSTARSG